MLGIEKRDGEIVLSKLVDGQWQTVASDIYAIIEGKIREHLYTEVFLK